MRHLAISFLSLTLSFSAYGARHPNIVFILADDMGYGDVQTLNPKSKIPTPHIDKLASEGMTFTDAHSPSAVCTPTRYGLLTGRYSWRTRLKSGVLDGYGEPLIEPGRATVASFLRQHDYHTGIVGKWHLGLGFAQSPDGQLDFSQPISDGPHTRGFDFSYVIPASLDFPPYLYIKNGKNTKYPLLEQAAQPFPEFLRKGERSPELVMEDCLDDLLTQATGYIQRQAAGDKPFLLYFPMTAPHKPVLPHRRFRGKTELGPYGDFIVQVDWTVGQVLKAIEGAGIREDTLVIYSSDNGSYMYRRDYLDADHSKDRTVQAYRSDSHRSNHVFRGTKGDVWEAGHHVPFFASWPGKIKADSSTTETICLTDIFATVAEIVGAELPGAGAEDSFSFLPTLLGKARPVPRAPVIHHSSGGMFSIRDGKWKLVAGNGSGGREKPRGNPFERPYLLFDMTKDISERRSVSDKNPDVAARMEADLERIRTSGMRR